jgi:hypothetical protein
MDLPLQQFLDWAETIKMIRMKGHALHCLYNLVTPKSQQGRFIRYFLYDDCFEFLKSDLEALAYDFHYETIIARPLGTEFFFYGKPYQITAGVHEWTEYWQHRTKIFKQNTKRLYSHIPLDPTDIYHLNGLLENILEIVRDVRAKVEALPLSPTLMSPSGGLKTFRARVKSIYKYLAKLEKDIGNLKASNN